MPHRPDVLREKPVICQALANWRQRTYHTRRLFMNKKSVSRKELSMDKQARPVLASLSMGLVWILLLVNIVYDYIRDHLITPYSVLMLFALVLGSTLVPRLLKQPNYSTKGWAIRMVLSLILLVLVGGYILLKTKFLTVQP